MTTSRRSHVLFAFALVYIFWGSTYLGIRIAITYVPPILMAGTRFLIAGPLLLAFCAMSRRRVRVTLDEFWRLALVGIMLLAISNAVLAWAENYVPSGLAALMVSIVPIWFLVIERSAVGSGDRVGPRGVIGVLLGIAGIVVLLWPQLMATQELGWSQLIASVSLLGSSFCWALGSVIARRWRLAVDALVGSGWEMLVAGVADVAVGLLLGQHHHARWQSTGVLAIFYLVIFGSWIGYSAYVWLLKHVPTPKVATYAYVNPVVAVLLGWLVLGESVDRFIVLGSLIIVPAVALVTSAEVQAPEAPAAES